MDLEHIAGPSREALKDNTVSNENSDQSLLQVDELEKNHNESNTNDITDRQKRFQSLIKRTEIYSHFVTKGVKAKRKKKKKKNGNSSIGDENENYIEPEQNTETFTYSETPDYITNGKMRDYQIEGLNWLISIHDNGISGILADDMGLGKTLQLISLLGYIKHHKQIKSNHLIIVPKTTINTWLEEFQKWCPSLRIICLYGTPNARKPILKSVLAINKQYDVCLTTYDMVYAVYRSLFKVKWNCVVLDEGHRIKNEKCRISDLLRKIKSVTRLILTGTPVNNTLHEVWALLNYLLPDIFNSHEDFDSWFTEHSCLQVGNNIIERLHNVLRPFVLRRCKGTVEKSLLPKIETKILIGLTKLQVDWFQKIVANNIESISNPYVSAKRLSHFMQAFRKCASHPYLFDDAEPGPPYVEGQHIVNNSGKMIVLDKLLKKLKSEDSRVLIFCQFRGMLDILEDFCNLRNYTYCRIDGLTSHEHRASLINMFNMKNSTIFIFMMTTKAGGLGINLQTADSVIVYTGDWNPQWDLQAMDRAHRIGQKKQVRVFRLITKNTIEERVEQLAKRKQLLDRVVMQQGLTEKADRTNNMYKEIILNTENIQNALDVNLLNEDIDAILARSEEGQTYEYAKDFSINYSENIIKSLTTDGLLTENGFIFNYCYNWTTREYKTLLKGIEIFGLYDILNISKLFKRKTLDDIYVMVNSFDQHYLKLHNYEEIISIIAKGRAKMKSTEELKMALKIKMSQNTEFKYLLKRLNDKDFSEVEDHILMHLVNNLGLDKENLFEIIHKSIVVNSSLGCILEKNFKNKTVQMIERRCNILINLIAHEVNEMESETKENINDVQLDAKTIKRKVRASNRIEKKQKTI